ncbi:type II toxin-antitoxin system RelE/ParE family toxin [Methylomonas sp. MS20]|uniref:type II toxin-antitoxin system RelE/ParE family toxin n=1 Tax=unclassified Methylomonas TaxID=2608980 RepID=UPI0028A4DC1D|nr:type II toxin-antitoxin system RelE/ParE family toxin [Methylomonas sp. MV1]MDT4332766.1 type II toxin-antitoxin system RelE/ParE family toxin [Methylomonas sp. MV1]
MPEASYQVLLTRGAEQDLESLYHYIAEFDSPANADAVLDKLLQTLDDLASFPERGNFPKELAALGIQEYRQVFFKPYRIVYRIIARQVYVYLIADGRRDMQALLTRRLLGG